MPYQVQQILEGKSAPVCIEKDEPVAKALSIMIEHDFSQLAVSSKSEPDYPQWLITYEGILRGIRNFKAKIDDLRVKDVMVPAQIYRTDDDLFDILDRLKNTNAVLVMHSEHPVLVGIVTSYDTTEYFRSRNEDLMRVEDIESMVKEFIKAAYLKEDGEVDEAKLDAVIAGITKNGHDGGKKKTFNDLTLGEYIFLLLLKENWSIIESFFGVDHTYVRQLLDGIRQIRNALAHFRGEISADQRDLLKFGMDWLSRCYEDYQVKKQEEALKKALEKSQQTFPPTDSPVEVTKPLEIDVNDGVALTEYSIAGSDLDGGRYARLADWLQSQPGRVDQVQLTFNQIEDIIQFDLPPSARNHRAWWANDSVGHTHSQLWLEAGWKTSYINMREGKVTFIRIREREKAYIDFFSKLLDEMRKKGKFPLKDLNPDGASWIELLAIPREGTSGGLFAFSFSRDLRLRVELYLDLGDQSRTKAALDRLYAQREQFEAQLGPMEWERLDNRRGSRIAIYHAGQIMDEKNHAELRHWAADTMAKFYQVMLAPAEQAIREAKQA